MTSKEALEHIIKRDYNQIICTIPAQQAYNGLTQEDMIDIVKKDLEVLQQYKDIEQEIGIDLITLFKAVKNGIFTKYDGEVKKEVKTISYHKDVMVYYGNKSKIGAIIIFYGDYNSQYCNLTDAFSYGETWALTKEELNK